MLPSNRASSLGMIMTTFVAIDFETANHRRDSACAVGLATGCNGRIVASHTYAIRPPTPQFSFTRIHGVRWEDVRDAPTFGDLWPTLRGWIDNVEFLAAHNASFDRSVLLACCARYRLRAPRTPFTLYRPACSCTMGNLPDDAARRLPTASYSAPSPRRRVGRGSVRAHRARRRGRRPHEKMATHAVTAGACGGLARPPTVPGSGPSPGRASRTDRILRIVYHPSCGRAPCMHSAPRARRSRQPGASPLTVAPADAVRARRFVARTAVMACVSAPPIGRRRLSAPRPPVWPIAPGSTRARNAARESAHRNRRAH